MKDMDKTKAELIQELMEIKQQHEALKAEYNQKKSEYEKAIDDLKMANAKADAKFYSLSEISQNFIHEFSKPLSVVLGFTELLKDLYKTNEEQKIYLEVITSSSKSLLQVLNMAIDLCRLEMGLTTIYLTETVINELITDICSGFLEKAKPKEIDFHYTNPLSSNEFTIKTDSIILFWTCNMLINHFLKSLVSGSIEFGYSILMGSSNIVGGLVNPYALEFFLKGKGVWQSEFEQDNISSIFNNTTNKYERRFRYDEILLVKPYVEMLGGKIWVQNEEGDGVSLYFTIPCKNNEILHRRIPVTIDPKHEISKQQEEAIMEAARNLKPLKILLVEHNLSRERLLPKFLIDFNHEVILANNGEEGVQAFLSKIDIDLILMEIQMPIMNGLEATQQIRRFDKDIIIIGFSNPLVNLEKHAIEVGMNDFLPKPFQREEFMALLLKHFRG